MSRIEEIESRVLIPSMRRMLARFDAKYGFINTKFNIARDEDFSAEESFRGKGHVYNWIQGRGLESLAKHILYFSARNQHTMAADLKEMLACVVSHTENCRIKNGGRLPFVMSPDGTALSDIYPQANFTDLFYGKGLFAAANVLNMPELADTAAALYAETIDKIAQQQFRTDQKSFDPKNPVEYVQGKHPQGPRMISLGGLADFAEAGDTASSWLDRAEEFINFILDKHVQLGQISIPLQKYDFIETIDANQQPRKDGEQLLCDPGHALEFVGLAGRCLLAMRRAGTHLALQQRCSEVLPPLFRHVFDYGFQAGPGGIVKTYDLITRKPTNSDMPWWNLPETIRAAFEMIELYPQKSEGLKERAELAWNAFFDRFLQPSGFACQTRDCNGLVVDVIPALPDADPGYHTNLSLMH